MSIEEIIERLEFAARYIEGKAGKTFLLGDFDVKALRSAIEKLRTHQDAQPNEPLTLEELRGMEGQPVWMVGDDGFGRNGWCFIRRVTYDTVEAVATNGLIYRIRPELISRTFKFYRRPPKEA